MAKTQSGPPWRASAFSSTCGARNSRQDWWQPGYWWGAAVGGVVVFFLCLGALQLIAALYYKRRHTLDAPEDSADEDEEH